MRKERVVGESIEKKVNIRSTKSKKRKITQKLAQTKRTLHCSSQDPSCEKTTIHSNFGASAAVSAVKMRDALVLIRERAPDLEVEGEMQGDVALSEGIRANVFPNSNLSGEANLLVMPSLDAGNIAFKLVKQLANGLSIGPILLGTARPAHILNSTVTVRGTLNMSALAVVDAQTFAESTRQPSLAVVTEG